MVAKSLSSSLLKVYVVLWCGVLVLSKCWYSCEKIVGRAGNVLLVVWTCKGDGGESRDVAPPLEQTLWSDVCFSILVTNGVAGI